MMRPWRRPLPRAPRTPLSSETSVNKVIANQLALLMSDLAMSFLGSEAQVVGVEQFRYTGIDLFESRGADASVGLSLIEAHRMLKATGPNVQLVPGDPFSALARIANSLGRADLVVISADQDESSLRRAWFYIPRILHAGSVVFIEQPSEGDTDGILRQIARDEVER